MDDSNKLRYMSHDM